MALLGLGLQVVVFLAHAGSILAFPFDLDQGEGYDVNAGWLLAQGAPIYTHNERFPYFSTNYPPVYPLAVAAAIQVWGATLLAGRIVSLAATLGIAALLFYGARSDRGGPGGLVAVGCFFLSNYVFHIGALARVNPLTVLLGLAGVLAVSRASPRGVTLGGLLLTAAILTKPTAVDAALAGTLWLLLRDHRLGLWLGGLVAGLVLTVGLSLDVYTDGAFSLNVLLGNVNPFSLDQLRDYLANFTLLHAAPLLLAGMSLWRAARARQLEVGHALLLAGLVMALGVGKWGAGESYFLTAIAAASLLAGREAARLFDDDGVLARIVPLLLLCQVLVSAHGFVVERLPGLADLGLQASALAAEPTQSDLEHGFRIVTRLQSEQGPALLEDPGFALAAGREVVGNATHLRNLHQSGLWQGERLLADLETRRYHTVVLDAELYPEPVLSAIGRYYFLFDSLQVHRAEQKLFVPGAS